APAPVGAEAAIGAMPNSTRQNLPPLPPVAAGLVASRAIVAASPDAVSSHRYIVLLSVVFVAAAVVAGVDFAPVAVLPLVSGLCAVATVVAAALIAAKHWRLVPVS